MLNFPRPPQLFPVPAVLTFLPTVSCRCIPCPLYVNMAPASMLPAAWSEGMGGGGEGSFRAGCSAPRTTADGHTTPHATVSAGLGHGEGSLRNWPLSFHSLESPYVPHLAVTGLVVQTFSGGQGWQLHSRAYVDPIQIGTVVQEEGV